MRPSIYLTGASGTGKTTLAKYIEETFGLYRLPSAARSVMADMGIDIKESAALIADKRTYYEFQKRVMKAQMDMEVDALTKYGAFVSDRMIDHFVYTALYGYGLCRMITSSEYSDSYIDYLFIRQGTYEVFFTHPDRQLQRAALAEGNRDFFLHWDQMNQFDGGIKFFLEFLGIDYTDIDPTRIAPQVRNAFVHARLVEIGLTPIKGK